MTIEQAIKHYQTLISEVTERIEIHAHDKEVEQLIPQLEVLKAHHEKLVFLKSIHFSKEPKLVKEVQNA